MFPQYSKEHKKIEKIDVIFLSFKFIQISIGKTQIDSERINKNHLFVSHDLLSILLG